MMKKFLIKNISILTAFAMVFSSHTVWALDAEQPLVTQEVCSTKTFVSQAGDGMVPVTFIHNAWTATIDGATWVWSEDPMSDTASEVDETFTLSFDVEGTPSDGDLEIAADNRYKIFINDNPLPLFVDEDEDNYSSADTRSIAASNFVPGTNTLTFEVKNLAQEGGTQESNPAGLMFKFTFEDCVTTEVEEPCGTENNPCEVPTEEPCPVVYARVNFSEIEDGAQADGWRNWVPGGDLEPQVFVGAADAQYDDEEWFPLTEVDGTTVLTDGDVSGYADVPGLAIERQDGKIRLVLYGFHNEENGELGGKEYAAGVLEIQGATWETMQSPLDWENDNTNPRIHDPAINDSVHPMESRGDFAGTIDQYDYRFDRMRTISPTKVSFTLVATAGADGFYASYNIPDCGEEPPCTDCNPIVILGCTDIDAINYDPEATEDNQSCQYPNDIDDSDGDENGGGGSSSGSSRRSSGGSVQGASTGPGGEVLGACVQFTQYHRKGDQGGEVARIQEFLNQEMNAGLVVDGYYGEATFRAVKDFQQKYFKEIITPWSPPLPLRVTGKWYKTTRMMANEIIACPETEVFLEDPAVMYKVKWTPAALVN